MLSLFRYVARTLIWLLILAGLIMGGLRLTLANVGLFRAEIESWVAEEIAQGISFGEIRCYWNGINPILELEKTAITLPDHRRPMAIDVVSIQFDLWDSLVLGTPVVLEVVGSIEKLIIRKDHAKQWWLNEIPLKIAEGGDTAGDLEDWLSSIPHFLQLELKRLIIEDGSRQRTHQVDNIFADLQHQDKVTHIQLSAVLPESLGGNLEVRSLLKGDEGLVYLQTEQLKLSPIADLLDVPLRDFRRVEIGGQAWVNLDRHRVSAVSGRLRIEKARYQPKLDEAAIPFRFATDFNIEKQGRNWQVANRLENIQVNQKSLPDIDMEWRVDREADIHRVQGWIDSLDISSYRELVASYLDENIGKLITGSSIQGSLNDIWLQLPVKDPTGIQLNARIENLKSRRAEFLPGVDQLDVELTYSDHSARAVLSSDSLQIDFGDEFRAPFRADSFSANADLTYRGEELILSLSSFKALNQDIRVAGRMWMESDLEISPFMSMQLEFDRGVASRKSGYLPVKLLPEKALKWLDDSIRGGSISNGHLLYHGRLQSIKVMDQTASGELHAAFDLDDGELQFDPDWAIARNAIGRLHFHNMGIDIDVESIDFDGIENASARIKLPTYADTSIIADIQATAQTGTALKTWLNSPVGADYREIASNLQKPTGRVKTSIHLFLPLEDDSKKEQVKVNIHLDNAAIQAPNWGSELSKANGLVTVTNDSISAKGIKALFFKDDVEINVQTDVSRKKTLIDSNGLMETAQLLHLLPEGITQGLDGKSLWQVNLEIANTPQIGTRPIVTIHAKSDLQGTEIYLPAPFSKQPATKRTLSGEVIFQANDDILFSSDYGRQVKSRGRLVKSSGQGYQLSDLEIALNTPLSRKPQRGIRLYGQLADLPLDEWIVFQRLEVARQKPGSRDLMPLIQSVDISVHDVALFGRKLQELDFHVVQSEAGFRGTIGSVQAVGKFFFPWRDSVQNPVIIDMDYLRVAKRVGPETVSNWIPDNFFNARFRSKVFAYDGREVNNLEIDTSIDGEFLLIDKLSFSHGKVVFESNGYWLYSAATRAHDSFLAVSIKGEEFGQTVNALGFGDTIHNGEINFTGELNWPAPIMDPTWDILAGKGRIKLEDGILKDVEPGSGRFVGLFSLSALPRRLALDFSDVLFDGLEFDEIKGKLKLSGQILSTENIELDGPAAEVKVVGRTGLRDRNYDQKIYVIPKIRHTLPVLGSIAAGSTVGWGLLLLQNLFKSSIDESVEIEYSMTGSWDDPVITVLNEPAKQVEEKLERIGNVEK